MIEGVERVLCRIEEIRRRFGGYRGYNSYQLSVVSSQKAEGRRQKAEFKDVFQDVEGTQDPRPKTQHLTPNTQNPEGGIDSLIDLYSQKYGIEPALVKAVIKVESNFNPNAVSPKGACGLMQLMPETARFLGVDDPFSVEQNIDGGVRYLRSLLDEFGGDTSLALAAYNAGPTLVKRLGRIPRIPETERYVQKVMEYYQSQL